MLLIPYKNIIPTLSHGVRIAENASLIGAVHCGENVGIWHGAALRADNGPIFLGGNTNVQENAVIHEDPGRPVTVGRNVTIGHGAILHGCTVEDGALIGMGAILLNGCVIGTGSLIAAGALVLQNQVIPPRSLAVGSPCRVVRTLTDEEVQSNLTSAAHYVDRARELLPPAEKGDTP